MSPSWLVVVIITLQQLVWTDASIAAIHSLHKAQPTCDVEGKSFMYTEELDFANRRRIIKSNACPNHFNKCQDEECSGHSVTLARENELTFDIPLYPEMAKLQVYLLCNLRQSCPFDVLSERTSI